MTGVELKLISDIDNNLFIKKGMRGGILYIAKRHNKIKDCYNKEKNSIIYWDANNLYGWGMNQPLPYGEFDWLTKTESNKLDLDSISENSSVEYFLEVDIKYPSQLHDSHSDYPLAPEKPEISSDMLSRCCSDIANKYGMKVSRVSIFPNLKNKSKYVAHYKNLQLYLSLGMKLSKIHRVLKFKQSNWLKEYIDFNPEKRKNVVSDFENYLF